MTLKLSEAQAKRLLGKAAGTPKRAKGMPPEDFEAALAFRERTGCWCPIKKDKRGNWYCVPGEHA